MLLIKGVAQKRWRMSGLETGQKVRFPLKERNNEPKKTTNKFVAPKEFRQKVVREFDQEAEVEVSQELQEVFNLAEAAYQEGLDGKAYEYYVKCTEHGTYHPNVLFECFKNIGNIKVRAGDLDGAEEFYNKAFTINPDSDVLLINLGTLEIQKQNYEKALERYRMAVNINPLNERAWIGLAVVHREYGDLELSWGNLERALDLLPDDDTSLELLVQWGVKDGRLDQVIEYLEEYMLRNPNNLYIKSVLSKVLIVGGRIAQAKQYIEEVLTVDESNAELQETLKVLNKTMNSSEN